MLIFASLYTSDLSAAQWAFTLLGVGQGCAENGSIFSGLKKYFDRIFKLETDTKKNYFIRIVRINNYKYEKNRINSYLNINFIIHKKN